MAENTVINYKQLQGIAKKMEAEGEAIGEILANLRQLVHDLQKDWIGTGSDAFFNEMETIVLPSMQRLSEALHFSAETTGVILKIYHGAEEDASAPFKGDLDNVNLGSTDFGAGQFGNLGIGAPVVNLGTTDFGASQFGAGTGPEGADSGGGIPTQEMMPEPEMEKAESGSGGGSGAGSSGLQGSLDKMGAGLGNQSPQQSSVGGDSSGGGAQSMPDYVYGSSSAAGSTDSSSQSASGGGAASTPSPNVESGVSAAGAAGIAGSAVAATGGTVKAVKGKIGKKKSS